MIRTALIAIALIIGSVAVSAQPSTDEHDQGQQGVTSLEALRQESIRLALDMPYAATDAPASDSTCICRKSPAPTICR